MTVWGMTGPAPNPLAALHLVAVHAVCAAVDEHVTRLALEEAATAAEPAVLGRQA
jgi:hypothetical protein